MKNEDFGIDDLCIEARRFTYKTRGLHFFRVQFCFWCCFIQIGENYFFHKPILRMRSMKSESFFSGDSKSSKSVGN